LLGHTDTSKVGLICIDCGKLLSLGSNKPGKQTADVLKCHLEKCHKDIYTLYMRKVESRQQGPPAKRRTWTTQVSPTKRRIVGLTWWLNVWKWSWKQVLITSLLCSYLYSICPPLYVGVGQSVDGRRQSLSVCLFRVWP